MRSMSSTASNGGEGLVPAPAAAEDLEDSDAHEVPDVGN